MLNNVAISVHKVWQIVMNYLAPEQRFQILEIYFEKSKPVREVHKAIRPFYGLHNR